jgi:amylosucrase
VFDEQRWKHRYDKTSAPGIMFQGLANLIRVRRQQQALAANAPRALLADAPDGLLALARGDNFLTLMNFTGQQLEYTLQGVWSDCAVPGRVEGTMTLAPYAMHWLARE